MANNLASNAENTRVSAHRRFGQVACLKRRALRNDLCVVVVERSQTQELELREKHDGYRDAAKFRIVL
jgi:hypothetical protein